MNNSLIERAKNFAHRAHDSIGHVRKYSGEPYWVHTDAVAGIVARSGGTPEMIAAAHLHDVVEDVAPLRYPDHEFGYEAIRKNFGENVFRMVFTLTDLFTHEDYPQFNRAQRKTFEANRLQWATKESKTIKLADIIHNTSDILANDPKFAKTYIKEASFLVARLEGGDEELWNEATKKIAEYEI